MSEGKGVSMPSCPIGFKTCYPSFECSGCMFWRNDKCDYEITMAREESVAQLATVSRLLAHVGELIGKINSMAGISRVVTCLVIQ